VTHTWRHWASFLLMAVLSVACAEALRSEELTKTVEDFCNAELAADIDSRAALVQFSGERLQAETLRKDPVRPEILDLDADPLVIVDSCKVIHVEEAGRHGSAIVEYRRRGRLEGRDSSSGRAFVPDERVSQETLSLTNSSGVWKVINPPAAHVGLKSIEAFYREEIELLRGVRQPGAGQRARLDELMKILETLPGSAPL
jgi:hypothetical protein